MAARKSSNTKITEDDFVPETEASKEFLNLLVQELRSIYWVEKHLTKALPKINKGAKGSVLKEAVEGQLAETKIQVERLEQIFEVLGEMPRTKKCEAMSGLVEEINSILVKTEKGSEFRDASLLLAIQKIAHYEIAAYTGLLQLARTFGNDDMISLLEETLAEESEAGDVLTSLAEAGIERLEATKVKKPDADKEEIVGVYNTINLTHKNIKR